MIKKVIVVHDSYTTPTVGWYEWIQNEFPKANIKVFVPKMPTPVGQSISSWRVMFEPYKQHLDSETVLIGHGTGALFVLRELEIITTPVGGTILIAPFIEQLPNEGLHIVNESFLVGEINWLKVHQNCKQFAVIAASGDTFVPTVFSQHVADLCGVKLQTIKHDGHFLAEFSEFPQISASIKEFENPTNSATRGMNMLNEELAKSGVVIDTAQIPLGNNDSAYDKPAAAQGIKSFYDDLGKTISTGDAESMALLLEDEREKEEEREAAKKRIIANVVYFCLGVVLLALGAYFLMQHKDTAIPIQSVRDPSPLRAEITKALNLPADKVSAIKALEEIRTGTSESKSNDLVLMSLVDTAQRPIGFANFSDTLGLNIPIELRSNVNSYVYGFWQGVDKEPFLILSLNSFDASYTGMRAWEQTVLTNLYRIVVRSDLGFTREGLTTAKFTDTIQKNVSIRQAILKRYKPTTKTIIIEDKKQESDFVHTYIFTPDWKAKVTDTSLTFTDKLPDSLVTLQKNDMIAFVANDKAKNVLKVVTAIDTKEPTAAEVLKKIPKTVTVTLRVATTDDSLAALSATEGYERNITSDGKVIYIKRTEEKQDVVQEIDSEPALVYAFINQKVLVITSSQKALDEIIKRLSVQNLFKK